MEVITIAVISLHLPQRPMIFKKTVQRIYAWGLYIAQVYIQLHLYEKEEKIDKKQTGK